MTELSDVFDKLPDDVQDELFNLTTWMRDVDPGNEQHMGIVLQNNGQWCCRIGESQYNISTRIAFVLAEGDRNTLKRTRELRGVLRINARNQRKGKQARELAAKTTDRLKTELDDTYKLLPLFTTSQ